jgi:hypothetical protein
MTCHGPMLAGSNQGNRLFRTDRNAQPAGLAGISVRGKRLMPAVSEPLELSTQTQAPAHLGRNGCHCEDFAGTDRDAFFLAFTAIAVDDRPDKTRRLFAVRFLDIHNSSSFEWFSPNPFRDPAWSD